MSTQDLWKYCIPEQVKKTLQSFNLLAGIPLEEEKVLPCLYAVSNHTASHYHSVEIPKRKGGMRRLLVPDDLLSTIQKNILRNVLCECSASVYASAYKKKSSVLDNVRPHVGAEQIVKLDIKDFFENISYSLVYQYAFPATHFPPAIRRILTELCCYQDYLPQGAPTSPAISNLVMKPFDEYMGAWCEERGICYTRYCDDLTFSWKRDSSWKNERADGENFLSEKCQGNESNSFSENAGGDLESIERSESGLNQAEIKTLIGKVRGFLHAYGFELNNKKTRVLKRNMRQSVTGIVVNEKPQVNREYRRRLRQEIYYCRKFGVESHLRRKYMESGNHNDIDQRDRDKKGVENKNQIQEVSCQRYLQKLLGKVSYVCLVNPEDQEFQKAREEVKVWMKNTMLSI